MKKLICVADIQEIGSESRECLIDDQTIITPAAADLAEERGITFVTSVVSTEDMGGLLAQLRANPTLLQQLMTILSQPFDSETDPSGFQLIHGESIHYQKAGAGLFKQRLFEHFPGITVEMVQLKKGSHQEFSGRETIQFLLKGKLITTIHQKSFASQMGDSFYYPSDVRGTVKAIEESQLLVIKATN